MKSKVVNFLGGPKIGKSAIATHLVSELKFKGVSSEYIPGFAKSITREGRTDKIFAAQDYIFGKQHFSLLKIASEVDIVVTDACLLNTLVYTPNYYPLQSLKKMAKEAYDQYDNLNIFILRSKDGNQIKEEYIELDNKIADMLHETKVEVHIMDYGRGTAEKIIKLMQAKKWLE